MSFSEFLSINYHNTPYDNPVVLSVSANLVPRVLSLLREIVTSSPTRLRINLWCHLPLPPLFCSISFTTYLPGTPYPPSHFPCRNCYLYTRISPFLSVHASGLSLMIKLRHKMVLCWPSIFTFTCYPCGSNKEEKRQYFSTTKQHVFCMTISLQFDALGSSVKPRSKRAVHGHTSRLSFKDLSLELAKKHVSLLLLITST